MKLDDIRQRCEAAIRALRCEEEYCNDDYAWSEDLHREAADLIDELTAENKRLREITDCKCDDCACDLLNQRDAAERAKEEI